MWRVGMGLGRIAFAQERVLGFPVVFAGFGADGCLVERVRAGAHTVTEAEIEAKVIDIVAEQMNVSDRSKITRETSFVEDLNADSLDTVELVMEFEDVFETSIPDDQAEKIKTVGEAIEFLSKAHEASGS